MAEYIRREHALSFPFANGQYDHENADKHFINGCETYKEWIEQMPVADVVEVVRCKDCVNYKTPYCTMDVWVGNAVLYRAKENDFCSYGKRKENG